MPQWTDAQQKTIDTRDKNILVSAAAGSGKTAVLIERIKTLIIDEHVDVDKFLITTFTKAASEEMKQRLEAAVREELSAKPLSAAERAFLLRQLQLLPGASIGTFHSFAIEMIRQYFYLTDLEPGFSILDEVQTSIMKKDAVDRLMEKRYEEGDEDFFGFLTRHSSDRNDNGLKDRIIKTYNSLRSIPHYMEWAENKTEAMNSDSPVETLDLMGYIAGETKKALEKSREYFAKAAELLYQPETQDLYAKATADVDRIDAALEVAEDYDQAKAFFLGKFNQMRAKKAEDQFFEEIKEEVKDYRDTGKDLLNHVRDKYYKRPLDEYEDELKAVYGDTKYMVGLVKEFEELYRAAKTEENAIDMDDVMHYAIDILEDEKAAAEQKEKFRYIFVDEYQDSNMLQETIVGSIARKDNLFMVGDVKQSIYKFRLAEPEIFMDKAKAFESDDDPDSMVINLNSNFRSKSRVTDTVNAIFRNVMPDYDEDAELHCTAPEEYPGYETTLHIVNKEGFRDEDTEAGELEAEIVCSLIRDALGSEIYDVKSKTLRKVQHRDIAVLARAGNTVTELERYLNNEGIPAYGDTGEGYFETVEIQVFINLLKVIDNMKQDVPLISVMRSAIFNFTVREMAKIRINKRDGSYCDAVREYAKNGPDRDLRAKILSMDEDISQWKELGKTVPLEELVRILLYDTGYYDYCSGLPVGHQRISNLQLIVEKATQFERSNHSGLNGFLRYIEAMADSNTTEAEAKTISENEDVVRVMTVHKSKGLEFPVVIFTGAGRRISGGSKNAAPLHKDFGIGLPIVNKEAHWRKKTLLQNVISDKQSSEGMDEAIRILYVALTRAKDRLEIVGTISAEDKLKEVVDTGSYIDMMYASLKDQEGVNIKMYNEPVGGDEDYDRHSKLADDLLALAAGEVDVPGEVADEINRRLSYEYEKKTDVPVKLKYSVTELNRDESGHLVAGDHSAYAVPIAEFEPDLKRHKLTAAEIGTIMHLIMEKIDFVKACDEGVPYIDSVADALVASGKIAPEERAVIKSEKIAGFFDEEVGKRAAKAFAEGKLHRENEFILEKEINGEPAVVQGIIDCWFEEDGEPVLIDYKNSYVGWGRTVEDIKESYKQQISIYKEALEGATGVEVKEAYLFLFDLGTFTQM